MDWQRGYSSIHTIRGVLRLAFQMTVDDEMLVRIPFELQLANVSVNDSVKREALSPTHEKVFWNFKCAENAGVKLVTFSDF